MTPHQQAAQPRTRTWRRSPGSAWIRVVVGAGVAALTAAGSAAGLWFIPLLAGAAAGAATRAYRLRIGQALAATCLLAALGWSLPLLADSVRGEHVGAVASDTAALAGLPPAGVLIIALTVLVAVAEAAAGFWLGSALAALLRPPAPRRPSRRRQPPHSLS